ncbi:MAG TPA: universal stress protein [Nitrososphaeraceae archaeon]
MWLYNRAIRYSYSCVEVCLVRRGGNAAVEILNIAEGEKVDTIIIGSKGLNTIKEFLLGSVS